MKMIDTLIADYEKDVEIDRHLGLLAVAQLKFEFLNQLKAVKTEQEQERAGQNTHETP